MDILCISNVSKSFGSHKIIKNLNMAVPEHTIYGFIGQNGAGKTTTMKMVLGLYTPDEGEIQVMGETVCEKNNTNRYIGYLPDVPEFYGFMTPKEYLTFCGELTGIKGQEIKKRSEELLELVGLAKYNKRIKGFSRGMKQRLGVAQALLSKPKLLICDEPTSALDPLGRKELLDILASVKGETTVIFSTHILSDVEKICDHIAFLKDGSITIDGTIEEIKSARSRQGLEIAFENTKDLEMFQKQFPDGEEKGVLELTYAGRTKEDASRFMRFLADQGILVKRFEILEPTLEELYVDELKTDTAKKDTEGEVAQS